MPFSPLHLFLLLFLLGTLLAFVQVGVLTIAFDKLGLSQASAFLFLISTLVGSMINLPLFQVRTEPGAGSAQSWRQRGLLRPGQEFHGRTVVAVNVGGGLMPVAFSAWLLARHPLGTAEVVLAVAAVAALCYAISRPMPGLGIGMPVLVAPAAAALVALVLESELSAPLAYICGTLGVIIGADLLRLGDIRRMGVAVASIGGAGTFDGVFITGIVAVLLA